jgi:hypothetical protein
MFLASLETRSFRFNAFDVTEDGAILALKAGLKKHAQRYLAHEPEMHDRWVENTAQDANVTAFNVGDCFRDYTLISNSNEPYHYTTPDNVRTD